MQKTIQRLTNAIKNGRFAFEKYYSFKPWHSIHIQVQDMFCGFRKCGYIVFVHTEYKPGRFENIATITHDWELNKTEIEYHNEWIWI